MRAAVTVAAVIVLYFALMVHESVGGQSSYTGTVWGPGKSYRCFYNLLLKTCTCCTGDELCGKGAWGSFCCSDGKKCVSSDFGSWCKGPDFDSGNKEDWDLGIYAANKDFDTYCKPYISPLA